MTYIKKSIPRAAGNPGIGITPRNMLVLIDTDDVLNMPGPNDAGVMIEDDIVLKPGRYAFGIYMTAGTAEVTSAAEGETDQIGFIPSIKFNHPGNEQEVREFKANCINKTYIGIMRYCDGRPADLIGTMCNPCRITPSYTGSSESNVNEMTMTQISKGADIFMYKGTIPLEEPVDRVGGESAEVTYVTDGQYQLEAGETAVASISGGKDNAVITLLGSEGGGRAVSHAEGKILLKGGKPFTVTAGSQLTLRAFEVAEGALVWIEQSRYVND